MPSNFSERPIRVGDPMPWFSARTITGQAFELQVSAGRWIVLCLAEAIDAPGAMAAVEALRSEAARLHEDRFVAHVVLRTIWLR